MATLTLWEGFSKRENSTKSPTEAGTEKTVKLKENVSVSSPVFIINEVNTKYSYAKYDDRYYFINDIIIINANQSELHCILDVLATYKTDIQLTSAFVKYHSHNNTEIADARLATNTTSSLLASAAAFDLLGSSKGENNAVIVNVVGKDSACAYALSQTVARTLVSNFDEWYDDAGVMPTPPGTSVFEEIVNGLTYMANAIWYACKQFFSMGNAKDCIRSAIMLPIPTSAVAGTPQNIFLGNYDTDRTGTRIGDRIFADGCTVSIPWQANDWRRNAPYHEIFLYIPYIGLVQISPSDVMDDETISVSVNMDYTSGDTVFTVYTSSLNHVIGQYNTNLGAPYPIGSSNITPSSVMTAVGSAGLAIGGAMATGGSSLAMASSGFLGLQNSLAAQPSCIGGACGGSAMGLDSKVRCYTIYHDTTVTPSNVSAVQGTPTNAVMALSTITGYVQTVNASVSGDMELSEKQKINSMLDSGIYIE